MNPQVFLDVDPRTLRFNRIDGIVLLKLQLQIAQHRSSIKGMPPILVYRGSDDEMLIIDGIHRAARVAKLLPGTLVRVEIVDRTPFAYSQFPTIGGSLP